jgi:hypothetical protein
MKAPFRLLARAGKSRGTGEARAIYNALWQRALRLKKAILGSIF